MSVECSECEWDARAGHDPTCSRSPESENGRLRAALERLVDIGPAATLKEWRDAQAAGAEVLGRHNSP